MLKNSFLFGLLSLFFATLLFSCEESGQPISITDVDVDILHLSVSPGLIELTVDDISGEQQITFQIVARVNEPENVQLVAALVTSARQDLVVSDTLLRSTDDPNSPVFKGELQVTGAYHDFEDYILHVYPVSDYKYSQNRAEARIHVKREPTGFPILETVYFNETIQIPEGEKQVFFIAAKAYHSLFNDFLNRVKLDLMQSNGDPIASYTMSDQSEFGNVSGDSIYVQGFEIDRDRKPSTYRFNIYAVDKAGTHSDTLSNSFTFVE